MQIGDLADRGRDDRRRRRAAAARLAEFGFDVARLAGKGRIDYAIERQRRGIGHHRQHVGEFDAVLALDVERELAEFVARGEAVATEQRGERGARVGRDGEIGGTHFVVDQPRQVALAVRIAADGGAGFGLLEQCAQRRGFAQFAGLDDDAAIARRRLQHHFDRRHDVVARIHPQQHGAAAAEQRHRVGFVGEPARIGRQFLAFDTRQCEGIGGIVDRGLHQGVDALADQTGIGTVHQHDRLARIGPGDEAVDIRGFDGGHYFVITGPP